MSRLRTFPVRRPGWVVGGALLLTALALVPLPELRIEADARRLLDEGHAARLQDAAVTERFELGDPVVVAIVPEEPATEPVDWPLVRTLAIAANVSAAARRTIGLPADRELGLMSLQPAGRSPIRFDPKALRDSPFLRRTLVSDQGESAALLLYLDPHLPRRETLNELLDLAEEFDGRHGHRVLIAGAPVAESILTEHILEDLAATIPAVMVTVGLLLVLGLGSSVAALVALAEVFLSLICTAGLMGWTGQPIYLPTAVIPVVLIAVGVCDEIYLYAAVRRLGARCPSWSGRQIVEAALAEVRAPVIMTSLTTALAFLSFTFGEVEAVRAVGVFCGIGVLVTMVFSLTLTPALWVLIDQRLPRKPERGLLQRLGEWMRGLPEALARCRRPIFAGAAVLSMGALAALPTLRVQDSWMANFDPQSPFRQATAAVDQRFAGTHRLLIQLDGHEVGAWYQPAALERLAAFERALREPLAAGPQREAPPMRAVLSAAGLVAEIERLSGRSSALPSSPTAVREALDALGTPAGDRLASSLITPDGRYTLVHLLLSEADYEHTERILAAVPGLIARIWPQRAPEPVLAGDAYVSRCIVGAVVDHQVFSLVGALGIAVFLAMVLLRSLRAALVAVAPAALTALLLLAGMAVLEIPLGIATSMVAGIGIGVGIDYALHLVSRWHRERGSATERLASAFATVGPSVTVNALVVGLGMLALLASQTPPLEALGALVCVSLLLSFALSLVLLPVLLSGASPAVEPTNGGSAAALSSGGRLDSGRTRSDPRSGAR